MQFLLQGSTVCEIEFAFRVTTKCVCPVSVAGYTEVMLCHCSDEWCDGVLVNHYDAGDAAAGCSRQVAVRQQEQHKRQGLWVAPRGGLNLASPGPALCTQQYGSGVRNRASGGSGQG